MPGMELYFQQSRNGAARVTKSSTAIAVAFASENDVLASLDAAVSEFVDNLGSLLVLVVRLIISGRVAVGGFARS
jgi:hypothetical protein